jgi:serine/threonine protein kinase
MAIESARGMAYLHAQEDPIVHRDLKSVNILVTATYGCKVADFGMSRVGGPASTSPVEQVVGTPLWLAPEVVRQEPHTAASDVFSFGIVLSEIYSRADPYAEHLKSASAYTVMMRVERDGLRPTIDNKAPDALKELIKDCVEDQPQRRPNMVEVLNRLYAMESSLNEDMRDMMRRTDNQEMWQKLVSWLHVG